MSVSYFVRYEAVPADPAEFLRYYREHHAPILARFPGIRRIILHSPAAWNDRFPVHPDRFLLLAQMEFDSQEDLDRALANSSGSNLVGRSPWTAWDALVPRTEAEAGASERARAPAPQGAGRCTKLSQGDTHFPPFEGSVYHQATVSEEVFST
jgi:uncharacterized protein (TIGR02118 family)